MLRIILLECYCLYCKRSGLGLLGISGLWLQKTLTAR